MKHLMIVASLILVGCGKLEPKNEGTLSGRSQERQRLALEAESEKVQGGDKSPEKIQAEETELLLPEVEVQLKVQSPDELVAKLLERCLAGVSEANRAFCDLTLDASNADESVLASLIAEDRTEGSTYFIAKMNQLHIYYGNLNKLSIVYDAEDRDSLSEGQLHAEFEFALREIISQLSAAYPKKAQEHTPSEITTPVGVVACQ